MLLAPGCLVAVFLLALFLIPFFYAQILLVGLVKLGLSPGTSLAILALVIVGSMVNIPVRRTPREFEVPVNPFTTFGFGRYVPVPHRVRSYSILAVNLGGAIIPALLAVFQILRVGLLGGGLSLLSLTLVTTLNVAICYRLARPVPGTGIVIPALVPPLVAACGALLLAPHLASPVAFTAGVLGPLIGADLMHLSEMEEINVGVASIGGAGTFDGIVLGGLVAAFLS